MFPTTNELEISNDRSCSQSVMANSQGRGTDNATVRIPTIVPISQYPCQSTQLELGLALHGDRGKI